MDERDGELFFADVVGDDSLGDDFDMLLPPIDGAEFLGLVDGAPADGRELALAACSPTAPPPDLAQPTALAHATPATGDAASHHQALLRDRQLLAPAQSPLAQSPLAQSPPLAPHAQPHAHQLDEQALERPRHREQDLDTLDSGSVNDDELSVKVEVSNGIARRPSAPPRGLRSGITTKGATTEAEKKAKRRKQIAAASRASRARRKQELEELREENQRLRDERSSFMSKIGELRSKVESMRELGSADMRMENAFLRTQLEEHKRFISHFKHLCDGAPLDAGARNVIYKQGTDSSQEQVLGLISQSQAEHWQPGVVPPELNIPYQNFHFCFKYKTEYGEKSNGPTPRRRLNVRVDLTFPGFQAASVSDFLWNSFSNSDIQQRLYRVSNIELAQLADDMPDKDTKMVYFREKRDGTAKDQDWVVICSRNAKMLSPNSLALPKYSEAGSHCNLPAPSAQDSSQCNGASPPPTDGPTGPTGLGSGGGVRAFLGGLLSGARGAMPPAKRAKLSASSRVAAGVLTMSTTQHSAGPKFENANRITSMFVQGAVTWDQGGDARVIIVFSFPDDFKIKAMEGFGDVIGADGAMSVKFAEVIKEFNEMLGEHGGEDGFVL